MAARRLAVLSAAVAAAVVGFGVWRGGSVAMAQAVVEPAPGAVTPGAGAGTGAGAQSPQQQDAAIPVPEVENSKYQFEGIINASSVLLRSGASDNFYPVMRMDKGDKITVVGIRFDWLKVLPPPGSFSFVSKGYVEKMPNGRGRVNRPSVNVRAGSTMTPLKTSIQTKLNEGDEVEIIDEQDDYYKIKPPAGAYFYVNKQFVQPTRVIGENAGGGAQPPIAGGAGTGTGTGTGSVGISGTGTGGTGRTGGGTSLSGIQQPGGGTGTGTAEIGGNLPPASTRPIVIQQTEGEKRFAQLEQQLQAASQEPIEQQPIDELLKGYQALASDAKVPGVYKRLAQTRVENLQARQQAKVELAEASKMAEAAQQRQQSLRAERQELEERLQQQQLNLFAAVGQLQTSSLQQGTTPLYRLTDPASGRTLVYLRSGDTSLAGHIGQLIGVRGEITDDPVVNVKTIQPTGFEPVEASQIGHVAARIMPPSMMSSAAPAPAPAAEEKAPAAAPAQAPAPARETVVTPVPVTQPAKPQ